MNAGMSTHHTYMLVRGGVLGLEIATGTRETLIELLMWRLATDKGIGAVAELTSRVIQEMRQDGTENGWGSRAVSDG